MTDSSCCHRRSSGWDIARLSRIAWHRRTLASASSNRPAVINTVAIRSWRSTRIGARVHVVRIGCGERLTDIQGRTIGRHCLVELVESLQHAAAPVVRHGQVVLRFRIRSVGLDEGLEDADSRLVAVERAREVTLVSTHVGDLVVRQGQVALPSAISGVGLCQAALIASDAL